MTQERAVYLLAHRTYGELKYAFPSNSQSVTHPDGITAPEWHEVVQFWNQMPGYTCFMDALWRISRGVGPREPVGACCALLLN